MPDCAELTVPLIFENLLKTISQNDLTWEPLREGIDISRIYSTPSGPALAFVRFEPGAILPRHDHDGFEHILILRGGQQDDNGDHQTGALILHPPGTSHQVASRDGCVVLAYWEKPVRFV